MAGVTSNGLSWIGSKSPLADQKIKAGLVTESQQVFSNENTDRDFDRRARVGVRLRFNQQADQLLVV